MNLYLLHKPYRMLSQFTDRRVDEAERRATLADVISVPDIYAAGRLDYDSEGLLLLSDDGALIHRISHPRHKQPKTYRVQVEGEPDDDALRALREGVELKDGRTRPAFFDTRFIKAGITQRRFIRKSAPLDSIPAKKKAGITAGIYGY